MTNNDPDLSELPPIAHRRLIAYASRHRLDIRGAKVQSVDGEWIVSVGPTKLVWNGKAWHPDSR